MRTAPQVVTGTVTKAQVSRLIGRGKEGKIRVYAYMRVDVWSQWGEVRKDGYG